MKIELIKQTDINNETFEPETWYFVKVNDSAKKATKKEEEAVKFYDALLTHYQSTGQILPVDEILKTTEI